MNIKVNDFSGPLDLLLSLLKNKKMDIYDIDIEIITKEYIDYINKNKELTIDSCSEYLVMASELIHLKSKQLLNKKDDDDDDEYEIKSEEELKQRLIEYQKIKDMTDNFKVLEEKRRQVFTKLPVNLENYNTNNKNSSNVSLDDLLKAFEEYLKRKKLEKPLNTTVTKKELSVEERKIIIRNILKDKKKIEFLELFERYDKPFVIVTFLSILDMSKNKEIKIIQDNNFSKIFIEGCSK